MMIITAVLTSFVATCATNVYLKYQYEKQMMKAVRQGSQDDEKRVGFRF